MLFFLSVDVVGFIDIDVGWFESVMNVYVDCVIVWVEEFVLNFFSSILKVMVINLVDLCVVNLNVVEGDFYGGVVEFD